MNMSTAYAIVWVSCSAAITTGIMVTGSLSPLWAFLIPACISISSSKKDGEKNA